MKRCFLLLLVVLILLCGCQSAEKESSDVKLLEFPGLDWTMTRGEVMEKYPGGTERQHGFDERIQYYENVEGVKLWGEEVILSFEFQDDMMTSLRCAFAEPNADEILKKAQEAYGEPWMEYTGQKGGKKWCSEERMIDRLEAGNVSAYKEGLIQLTDGMYGDRYDYEAWLYSFACEDPMIQLEWDDRDSLTWRVSRYNVIAGFSEWKEDGEVASETLLKEAEKGTSIQDGDGMVTQIRLSLTSSELEQLKKRLGPSCQRYLSYDMPEGSLFWVSEKRVDECFEKEVEKKSYLALLGNRGMEQTQYEMYLEMYRTPLIKAYWDEASGEMVWDLTGQANLERIRE